MGKINKSAIWAGPMEADRSQLSFTPKSAKTALARGPRFARMTKSRGFNGVAKLRLFKCPESIFQQL